MRVDAQSSGQALESAPGGSKTWMTIKQVLLNLTFHFLDFTLSQYPSSHPNEGNSKNLLRLCYILKGKAWS